MCTAQSEGSLYLGEKDDKRGDADDPPQTQGCALLLRRLGPAPEFLIAVIPFLDFLSLAPAGDRGIDLFHRLACFVSNHFRRKNSEQGC